MKKNEKKLARRDFFKKTAAGVTGMVAGIAVSTNAQATEHSFVNNTETGYRVTDHVAMVYATARF